MQLANIVARWPGSVHNPLILTNSMHDGWLLSVICGLTSQVDVISWQGPAGPGFSSGNKSQELDLQLYISPFVK